MRRSRRKPRLDWASFCIIFAICWLFCCLIWWVGEGENLVLTWLHFAWFLLFIGSGAAWFYAVVLLDLLWYCIVFLILVLSIVATLTETPRQYVFIRDNEKANRPGGWGRADAWFTLVILILDYCIVSWSIVFLILVLTIVSYPMVLPGWIILDSAWLWCFDCFCSQSGPRISGRSLISNRV
jgi:hypothetical protein